MILLLKTVDLYYPVIQTSVIFYHSFPVLHSLYILAGHLDHSCIFISPFHLGHEMVRRWVTARKSITGPGPGPVVRFEMLVEVEVSCID